jgi:catechol 2,3-dioxygenase-like lactoylglutathione lyase family enzyme
MAMIAVKDREKAKAFYSGVLGLVSDEENMGGVSYRCGDGQLFVYEAPGSAGTSQATSANWYVDDIESVVSGLKAKGVMFEHYDIPEATYDGDVAIIGPMKVAWFKDPDGNILGLSNS